MLVLGLALLVLPVTASAFAADEELPVLTDHGAASALVVDIQDRCSNVQLRVPEAVVTWHIAPGAVANSHLDVLEASDEFRIDISPFPEGLERGQYDSLTTSRTNAVRVFASEGSVRNGDPESLAIVAGNLQPGVYYRTRVLVLTPDGWVASREVQFMSAVCAVDGLDEYEGGER